ncbi:MAG: hypothetical protein VKS61_02140 [Candidatus Sericytochromatia bacterium]|nr:hypothetical protein [Candidatus Sericytochromatia bacterium]
MPVSATPSLPPARTLPAIARQHHHSASPPAASEGRDDSLFKRLARQRRVVEDVTVTGVGGAIGTAAGVGLAAVARANPLVGAAAGLTVGAMAGLLARSGHAGSSIGREPGAAALGSLAGGGLALAGALTLGLASGPIVVAASVLGAAAGAFALAKLAD